MVPFLVSKLAIALISPLGTALALAVAGLLLAQAEAAERGEVAAPLTQADMAARLGTVREMVARTLKSFEALGLISLERGSITIRDRAGLVKMHDE